MKKKNPNHVKADACPQLIPSFSLDASNSASSNDETESCPACSESLSVLQAFKNLAPQEHHPLIEDIALKLKLCVGHSVRVANVSRKIVETLKKLSNDTALAHMEFKLKFEPLFFR